MFGPSLGHQNMSFFSSLISEIQEVQCGYQKATQKLKKNVFYKIGQNAFSLQRGHYGYQQMQNLCGFQIRRRKKYIQQKSYLKKFCASF